MLTQEKEARLAELGFDVEGLKTAISSEEEVDYSIPELYKEKGLSNDDMTVFGKNRFDEGKQAMSEIMAKSYKEKYGIDVEGKNLDNVVDAIKEKYSTPADNAELEGNFKELQSKYSELESTLQDKEKDFENRIFTNSLIQSLSNEVPKNPKIPTDKMVKLYMLDNDIDNVDGSAVVKINGEIQKDHLLNPIPPQQHFKEWIDTNGFVEKKGMGGKDSSGSSSVKFSNISEFTAWCEKNDKEPMSDEMQKYYLANKS